MHEGHRERLISKLIANTDSLSSHEVLEILLFYSIPRKNTNGLAHKLLDTFGDLSGVFSANYDALIAVEGIGPAAIGMRPTASYHHRTDIPHRKVCNVLIDVDTVKTTDITAGCLQRNRNRARGFRINFRQGFTV